MITITTNTNKTPTFPYLAKLKDSNDICLLKETEYIYLNTGNVYTYKEGMYTINDFIPLQTGESITITQQ